MAQARLITKINADGFLIHLLSTHLHKAESCLMAVKVSFTF